MVRQVPYIAFPSRGFNSLLLQAILVFSSFCPGEAAIASQPERGMPFVRTYSFEEMGYASPGLRMSQDQIGRLWIIQEGSFMSFDNLHWNELLDPSDPERNLSYAISRKEGNYFGAAGNWGSFAFQNNGLIDTTSFRDETAPAWTSNTTFVHIETTSYGVAFAGGSGLVFHNSESHRNYYFQIPETLLIFSIHDEIYLSSYTSGLCRLDRETMRLIPLQDQPTPDRVIECVTYWDENTVMGMTYERKLVLFDGTTTHHWPTEIDDLLSTGTSALLKLDPDHIALSLNGNGLFILDAQGNIRAHHDDPSFRNINDLILTEPGILWISSGAGVSKLVYEYPVSMFDHRCGLILVWPSVIKHKGQTIVITSGRLYRPVEGCKGALTHFENWDLDIFDGIWVAGSTPEGLLLGNAHGLVFRSDQTQSIIKVLDGFTINRIQQIDSDGHRFLIIGESDIAAIRWDGEQWVEYLPRVAGVGFPSLIHSIYNDSVWVELGLNRIAHLSVTPEAIRTEIFDDWDAQNPVWINVGNVGTTIVVTHSPGDIRFYEETTASWTERPDLLDIFSQSPHPILRPKQSKDGTIWMGYDKGVFKLEIRENGAIYDTESLQLLSLNYPICDIAGNEVWVRAENILYRIDTQQKGIPLHQPEPVLISMIDSRRNALLFDALQNPTNRELEIPYASNSLNIHFFPGTYSMLRNPKYQYQLEGYSREWSQPVYDSTINLTSLHEGSYTLNIRMLYGNSTIGVPCSYRFTILPPIYRTWYAYLAYLGLALLLLSLLISRTTSVMKRRNRELEKLVKERTSELEILNQNLREAIAEAHAASEAKGQFLANMSHEIRTPMNGVMGMCSMLEETPLSKEQQNYLGTLRVSSETLLTIINDILDFSKIEAGKMSIERIPFDLHHIIDDVMDLVAPLMESKTLELVHFTPVSIAPMRLGDPTKIRQVILNLVSNAIKFTESGFIELRVQTTGDPDMLEFLVRDTGIGISEDTVVKLFSPFCQGDQSTSRKFGGTGLGLSISKMLTEHMGGTIWVDSELGKGSCFHFTLPLPPANPSKTGEEGLGVRPEDLPEILIFETQALPGEMIGEILEGAGYSYQSCSSPDIFSRLVTQLKAASRIHLIDLDQSPFSREMMITASSDSHLGRIHKIILTGDNSFDPSSNTIDSNRFASILHKPLRRYQLLELLREHRYLLQQQKLNLSEVEAVTGPQILEAAELTNVLVVEDNQVNQKVASLFLKRLGFHVDIAGNGREAIQSFQRQHYDVILMDIQMPEMDGIEATEEILKLARDRKNTQLPLIYAMSAGVSEKRHSESETAGMIGFISKPIKYEDLRIKLTEALSKIERIHSREQ